MAITYTGTPEEVMAFGQKLQGAVDTMEGHMSALDNVRDQFRSAVSGSETGSAIQTSFTNAVNKGRSLLDLLRQASEVMNKSGAKIDLVTVEGAGRISKGDYNF
ncbi:WXG100 family type VII secretion target [Nocardia cyriacigeorgica]|uniref:Uncharacterized protein n=1 Tax=Nocardia cyriacigeorgica TaxID=135487 RepID=A0A4U8W6P6_9NOCA|nr:hypothetical protein [Nocardia cyriacigeorgica]MBF6097901.1 hypothetical protein [Nocardia cyriacigeorgica]MBF6158043.1 hypothetical protein [Nocardia cyriacigeorgica]MBF6197015.1 hypothetical protein [Nocardia cyriacigeorgica]MBF6317716.1 hypothetical protein [Nocardia cyriacigeorgica]MBF6344557.1 hypothetical protein [Nocardia cyriacigeorgica]